jgi:hypothetical protein
MGWDQKYLRTFVALAIGIIDLPDSKYPMFSLGKQGVMVSKREDERISGSKTYPISTRVGMVKVLTIKIIRCRSAKPIPVFTIVNIFQVGFDSLL